MGTNSYQACCELANGAGAGKLLPQTPAVDKASQGHRESFSQVSLSPAWKEEEFLGIEAFWVVERKKKHGCGTCRHSQCSQPSCTFKSLGSKILLGVDWHIHKSVQGVSEQLDEFSLSEHTKYNQHLEGLSRGS